MSIFGKWGQKKNQDTMSIDIEEDGTITVKTDEVSARNHKAADDFIKFVQRAAGGATTKITEREKFKHSHGQQRLHTHHKH